MSLYIYFHTVEEVRKTPASLSRPKSGSRQNEEMRMTRLRRGYGVVSEQELEEKRVALAIWNTGF